MFRNLKPVARCAHLPAGFITVYSATGWVRYRTQDVVSNPLVIVLGINGQQYRLCINLRCPFPSQVSS